MNGIIKNFLAFAVVFAFVSVSASWCQEHSAQGQNQPTDQTQATDPGKAQASSQASPPPSSTVTSAQATGQNPSAQEDPLAEAARKAREHKKENAKGAKVFTNDDIAGAGGISSIGVKPNSEGSGNAPAAGAASDRSQDEKAWRRQFADLHSKLDRDQADLDVMQRELGVLDVQYYSDPVKGMQQGLTRSDINDQTAKIDKKKEEIEADKQAINDAEDDLRKAGGDPGWAR